MEAGLLSPCAGVALFVSVMPQLVQRAQIFFREPCPALALPSPQIAGQASGQALAAIVDLD